MDDFSTIKVKTALRDRILDEQDRQRRARGRRPTVSEVVEEALDKAHNEDVTRVNMPSYSRQESDAIDALISLLREPNDVTPIILLALKSHNMRSKRATRPSVPDPARDR